MSELSNHPGLFLSIEIPGAQLPRYEPQAASSAGFFIDSFRAVALAAPYLERFQVLSNVTVGFERHCAAEFEQLAQSDPSRLIALARADFSADPVLLAMAAEALALSTTEQVQVVTYLRSLLVHQRPFVREAALHGLTPFFRASPDVIRAVERMAREDVSPGVRAAAGDLLSLW